MIPYMEQIMIINFNLQVWASILQNQIKGKITQQAEIELIFLDKEE